MLFIHYNVSGVVANWSRGPDDMYQECVTDSVKARNSLNVIYVF